MEICHVHFLLSVFIFRLHLSHFASQFKDSHVMLDFIKSSSERARASFRFYTQTFCLPACWSTKVILTSQNILPKICLQLSVSKETALSLHVSNNITRHLFCVKCNWASFTFSAQTKTKKTSCVPVCTCHSVSSEHREKTHISVNRESGNQSTHKSGERTHWPDQHMSTCSVKGTGW